MSALSKKGSAWPDRRPPLPRTTLETCLDCGHPVARDERLDGVDARHLVCDRGTRTLFMRRMVATRAVHRLARALASMPTVAPQVEAELRELPDACDVVDALTFGKKLRTAIECTRGLPAMQRRIAISLLDSTEKQLSAC